MNLEVIGVAGVSGRESQKPHIQKAVYVHSREEKNRAQFSRSKPENVDHSNSFRTVRRAPPVLPIMGPRLLQLVGRRPPPFLLAYHNA